MPVYHIKNKAMDLANEFLLTDKVIVVTGGTGILGEAFINGIAGSGGVVVFLVEMKKWLPKE